MTPDLSKIVGTEGADEERLIDVDAIEGRRLIGATRVDRFVVVTTLLA